MIMKLPVGVACRATPRGEGRGIDTGTPRPQNGL